MHIFFIKESCQAKWLRIKIIERREGVIGTGIDEVDSEDRVGSPYFLSITIIMNDEIHSVDSLEIIPNNSFHRNRSDSHFMDLLNEKLGRIQHQISIEPEPNNIFDSSIHNNSPASLSNSNSDNEDMIDNNCGSRSSNYDDNSHYEMDELEYRKLSYFQVERSLEKQYESESSSTSNELDILITYMKGQKNLYIKSKNAMQYKLNCLLVPALLITASITIFAPFVQVFAWSGGFISGLNALSTMLISLSNYWKLESSMEMFFNTANQYDKLETSLEFVSSKLMFLEKESDKSKLILKQIQDVEKKIEEIKQWNSLFIPDEVRRMFPIICNINIFSFIKRIESNRRSLIIRLKDVKNEIRYIFHLRKLRSHGLKTGSLDLEERENCRLKLLLEVKDKTKEEVMKYRSVYSKIDEMFTREIHSTNSSSVWSFFNYRQMEKNDRNNDPFDFESPLSPTGDHLPIPWRII